MGQSAPARARHAYAGPQGKILHAVSAVDPGVLQAPGRGECAMSRLHPLTRSGRCMLMGTVFCIAVTTNAQSQPAVDPPAKSDVAPGSSVAPSAPGSPGAGDAATPTAVKPAAGDNQKSEADRRPANSAENNPAAGEMTEQLHQAVAKGLEYLKGQQNSDGSFGHGRYGKHVGITALCGLAFMADGNLPGRGPFGDQVSKALEFVLDHSTETGLLTAEESHGPMYGHGFATLFLGEIYGMNPEDKRVREALVKAVELIVGT